MNLVRQHNQNDQEFRILCRIFCLSLWLLGIGSGCSNSNFAGGSPSNSTHDTTADDGGSGEADDGSGSGGGDDGGDDTGGQGSDDGASTVPTYARVSFMVNDLECSFCHTKIVGDVASVKPVPPFLSGSNGLVTGSWYSRESLNLKAGMWKDGQGNIVPVPAGTAKNNIRVDGNIKVNYTGSLAARTFPNLDWNIIKSGVGGKLSAKLPNAITINKKTDDNVVLIGTTSDPIVLDGDVYVGGDLVIAGVFQGMGSIYVAGNIYIPRDLKATKSVFPFPSDRAAALAKARSSITTSHDDGLGLATAKSIFIGDLGRNAPPDADHDNSTIYSHPWVQVAHRDAALGVSDVYQWFPGGETGYRALYGTAKTCVSGQSNQFASFERIEAFMYAKNTIAGIARRTSYAILGGIVADKFHVVSGASKCGSGTSAAHGMPSNYSYVVYDMRFKTGQYPVLKFLGQEMK